MDLSKKDFTCMLWLPRDRHSPFWFWFQLVWDQLRVLMYRTLRIISYFSSMTHIHDGSPETCHPSPSLYSLYFELLPFSFPMERSKCLYIVTILTGQVQEGAVVKWKRTAPFFWLCCWAFGNTEPCIQSTHYWQLRSTSPQPDQACG